MSAASFGGSFNLVQSDDNTQRNMFNAYMKRIALDAQFPFLRHLPGVPSASSTVSGLIERIVSKRRKEMEKGITRKDILQIFMDTHNADPISFTDKHVQGEMILFMHVCQFQLLSYANHLLGSPEVIPRVSQQHSHSCFFSITRTS